MTSPALAAYTFLPWVQGGVGRSIVAADEPTTTLPARVTLPVVHGQRKQREALGLHHRRGCIRVQTATQ